MPIEFQEFQAPRYQDNRHMKVVRLSALRAGHLYPLKLFLILISVGGWVKPGATVRPEGLRQWKIPVTPSGPSRKIKIIKITAAPLNKKWFSTLPFFLCTKNHNRGNSWLATNQLASQKRLCCMELVWGDQKCRFIHYSRIFGPNRQKIKKEYG
jgi:hypothetical protein